MLKLNKKLRLKLIAITVALLVIITLLFLLLFSQQLRLLTPDKITVRQISFTANKPPPPPKALHQNQVDSSASLNIDLNSTGPAMQFSQVKLANTLQLADLPLPEISDIRNHFFDNLHVNWQAYGLNEIDGQPVPLTNIDIVYPISLVKKGFKSIKITLDVLIDESGKAVLRQIIDNPHPEIEPHIHKLIKDVRFTAPKKNGISVRAAFLWPLEFNHS